MYRVAVLGMIPMVAGFLAVAQEQTRTETRTTTTWNGRLVDAACESSHTEHTEITTTKNPDSTTTRTQRTRTDTVCPVTPATMTFGILTSDGRFIRFDDPGNVRVREMMKDNHAWSQSIAASRPVEVQVVGTPNGDVTVVDSISSMNGGPATVGQADRMVAGPVEQSYDVRWKDDRGRLIISPDRVSFEDLSNGKHSRSWSYAEIRELKRDSGREIKIQPYSGDKYEMHISGSSEMADDVYRMIGDRIVAARGH
jgi:hypothetical protein